MIDLVLQNTRHQPLRFEVDRRASGVQPSYFHGNLAFDFDEDAGQAEAALGHPVDRAGGSQAGIDHTNRFLADIGDDGLHEQAHLGRRQTNARVSVHQLQHVPRQTADIPAKSADRLADLAQHGIRVEAKSKRTPREIRREPARS